MASITETCTEVLPAVPGDITARWLESKLGHKIRSVSLSLTRSIFGTASKLFFTIEYADEVPDPNSRPTHICVKGVFDPAMAKSQPWTVDLAQREADFFDKLAPLIKNMGYPKGWWGGRSDTQGIVIMSDLVYEGCTFPPEVTSYPLERVLDGAAQIAALHARFWGKSQDDYPCRWKHSRPYELKARNNRRLLTSLIRDFQRLRRVREVHHRAVGRRRAGARATQASRVSDGRRACQEGAEQVLRLAQPQVPHAGARRRAPRKHLLHGRGAHVLPGLVGLPLRLVLPRPRLLRDHHADRRGSPRARDGNPRPLSGDLAPPGRTKARPQ